jgi:hypothetical protein
MPLIRIDSIGENARLALWKMSERVEELPHPNHIDLTAFRSASRLKEKLTTYALIKELTGLDSLELSYASSGKPLLDGFEISISHTIGWAVVVLSRNTPVAVDIEYRSDRVTRITDRFIRADEDKSSVDIQLINWSAKETMYKLFSEEQLQFHEMRLQQFTPSNAGKIRVEDLKYPKTIEVEYILNADYVLTWALFHNPSSF